MTARTLPALVAALILLGTAPAAVAEPLAGSGDNLQPIAHLPIGDADEQKNEIDLAGDHAYVSWDGGLEIVNISDPAKPFVEGRWKCEAGWGDVDLSADGNIAVLTNAHLGECREGDTAVAILDVSDKKNPNLLSTIDLGADFEYIHTATLNGDLLFLNPQIWAGYPQTTGNHIPVYDIGDPRDPVLRTFIEFPGPSVAHDSFVDRRPDGSTLLYSASVHTTDVFDITNVLQPVRISTTTSPEMTISHQAEPNHDRSMIVVVDESAADGAVVGDGLPAVCGRAGGPGPVALDVGSIHFYAADDGGGFANGGVTPLGSWNTPPTIAQDGTCTAHVFWQAPDENRLTQAWYTEGAHVLDFSDPANVQDLASFKAEPSTMYWSAKPHRGYLFATDMTRGLDVLRYTGEDGRRWPATAGPAEVQRARWHGVEPAPAGGTGGEPLPDPPGGGSDGEERKVGRFAITRKLGRVPGPRGRRAKLRVIVRDTAARKVATARFRRPAGRRARVRLRGVAEAGRYRFAVRRGKRTIKRGRFTVRTTPGLTLSPGDRMALRVR